MIQNLIKQAFLDGYTKGEKCNWIKPNEAKENMANGYAVEVVNKNDLLPDVSGSYCDYLSLTLDGMKPEDAARECGLL